jgi:hypothetical protein
MNFVKFTLMLIFFVALAAPISASSLQDTPPPPFPPQAFPTPTLKTAPVTALALGSFVVRLGRTTLGEVVEEIGKGTIAHEGDASESTYWVCYSITKSQLREQLWLLSSGEMDGVKQVIYGVVSRIIPAGSPTGNCPELPHPFRAATLNSKIWLGTAVATFREKMGEPSLEQEGWLHYASEKELPGDPRAKEWRADMFYELGGLSVRMNEGRVVELWATFQETA